MGKPLYPPVPAKDNGAPLRPYMLDQESASSDDSDFYQVSATEANDSETSKPEASSEDSRKRSIDSSTCATSAGQAVTGVWDHLYALLALGALIVVCIAAAAAPHLSSVSISDAFFARIWSFMSPHVDAHVKDIKESLNLSTAWGNVLEVGPGTGANLGYYSSKAVTSLTLLEPNTAMHAELLHTASMAGWNPDMFTLRLSANTIESASFPPASFDFIVSTFVLCSVDDLPAAVERLYDWLKPGGTFVFLEHIGDEKGKWARWGQDMVSLFLWPAVAGGCRLNHDTMNVIQDFDWKVDISGKDRMASGVLPIVWGRATKKKGWFGSIWQ
ncbi:hypothetical protein SpCBS45565_g02824 [Spizellomyces sp. 'palustris']|nr:hypothetical protein SpCBS45565_g02824 [Spizellomyces sp. 'palustris']